ncbi:unnamed protein product [Penicillium salamii]|nr:unnamed protein product [Penicillium salamii]CAG8267985.1 unnamed protein product [Penicillium salamii]
MGSYGPTGDANGQIPKIIHAATTDDALMAEKKYSARNYESLTTVFARAQGAYVWDPEGKQYLDFNGASTALIHGHCHPKLVAAFVEQASRLTLTSRAFHNDVYPKFTEIMTRFFGYDRLLPATTGAESVETAIKIARKWSYKVKGVPQGQAIVLVRSKLATTALSSSMRARENYGPLGPTITPLIPRTNKPIVYNDKAILWEAFETAGSNLAGFIVEPILGDAGVVVPDDDYLQEARALCDKHNVLLICDEIQPGIARTGKLLGHYWSGIRPDLVILGKTMSGGLYPVSCVLGDNDVILTIEPGTHGSTFGGNPLGSAVVLSALRVLEEENLAERAEHLGNILRQGLKEIQATTTIIETIRGRGLLNAFIIDQNKTNGHTGIELCELMTKKGLLLKSSPTGVIRISPPLIITDEDMERALAIIKESIIEFTKTFEGSG